MWVTDGRGQESSAFTGVLSGRLICESEEKTTHLRRVLQLVHGGVLDALSGGGLGRLHEVAEGGGHVLDRVDQHDLRLAVGRAEAGGAGLDHLGQLDDGGDGVLGGDRELLLGGGRAGHQGLRVLHQCLGGLQDVFAVVCSRKTN